MWRLSAEKVEHEGIGASDRGRNNGSGSSSSRQEIAEKKMEAAQDGTNVASELNPLLLPFF